MKIGEKIKDAVGNKYFGTDGFRGEANVTLTSMQAYKVGRFLGWYYSNEISGCKANHRPKIVIGKDTRRSSYMLEYSIVAGITASGADAYMLHVTTTPSVSYVARQDEFDCGIMITASHNPFYDNGIKVINKYGEKLDDKTTALIEAYLDGDLNALGVTGEDLPLATKERIGCIIDYSSGRNRYLGYLISLASHSYKNLKIGLDCANGASWMIAKSVFAALGAQVTVIGAEPDGLNVNENCGSTHIENLCKLVKEKRLDVGFAFDGDADRCIAVDGNGEVVDGDKILYLLGKRLKLRGMLNHNTVVADKITVNQLVTFIVYLECRFCTCVKLLEKLRRNLIFHRSCVGIVGRIAKMNDNVGKTNLVKRTFESFYKMVGKSVDESNRVGEHQSFPRGEIESSRCRIERRKKLVLLEYSRIGELVEKCRFSRVCVSNDSNRLCR